MRGSPAQRSPEHYLAHSRVNGSLRSELRGQANTKPPHRGKKTPQLDFYKVYDEIWSWLGTGPASTSKECSSWNASGWLWLQQYVGEVGFVRVSVSHRSF